MLAFLNCVFVMLSKVLFLIDWLWMLFSFSLKKIIHVWPNIGIKTFSEKLHCFHPFEVKSRKCNVSSNEMNGSVSALGEHQSVCVLVNLYKWTKLMRIECN